MFSSDRRLINGVDMNIKRKREPEGFYYFALSNDTKNYVSIS